MFTISTLTSLLALRVPRPASAQAFRAPQPPRPDPAAQRAFSHPAALWREPFSRPCLSTGQAAPPSVPLHSCATTIPETPSQYLLSSRPYGRAPRQFRSHSPNTPGTTGPTAVRKQPRMRICLAPLVVLRADLVDIEDGQRRARNPLRGQNVSALTTCRRSLSSRQCARLHAQSVRRNGFAVPTTEPPRRAYCGGSKSLSRKRTLFCHGSATATALRA